MLVTPRFDLIKSRVDLIRSSLARMGILAFAYFILDVSFCNCNCFTMAPNQHSDEITALPPSTEITGDAIELPTITSAAPELRTKIDDPYLVAFDERHDPANPKHWSRRQKWAVTDVLSATGFNRIMVSTIMAPALPLIARELNMSSTESTMSLSIYLLATAFGPLFIGPLSEMYGRSVVLHVSNVWFLVFNIVCGFAATKGVLIGARFMAGFGASSIYALAGGVMGDVWSAEERGKTLGVYLLIPLLGSAVGKYS